jgi:hypothetical protein
MSSSSSSSSAPIKPKSRYSGATLARIERDREERERNGIVEKKKEVEKKEEIEEDEEDDEEEEEQQEQQEYEEEEEEPIPNPNVPLVFNPSPLPDSDDFISGLEFIKHYHAIQKRQFEPWKDIMEDINYIEKVHVKTGVDLRAKYSYDEVERSFKGMAWLLPYVLQGKSIEYHLEGHGPPPLINRAVRNNLIVTFERWHAYFNPIEADTKAIKHQYDKIVYDIYKAISTMQNLPQNVSACHLLDQIQRMSKKVDRWLGLYQTDFTSLNTTLQLLYSQTQREIQIAIATPSFMQLKATYDQAVNDFFTRINEDGWANKLKSDGWTNRLKLEPKMDYALPIEFTTRIQTAHNQWEQVFLPHFNPLHRAIQDVEVTKPVYAELDRIKECENWLKPTLRPVVSAEFMECLSDLNLQPFVHHLLELRGMQVNRESGLISYTGFMNDTFQEFFGVAVKFRNRVDNTYSDDISVSEYGDKIKLLIDPFKQRYDPIYAAYKEVRTRYEQQQMQQ